MFEVSRECGRSAIEARDTVVAETRGLGDCVTSDGTDEHWFRDLAQSLLPGDKAGTFLWSLGIGEERSCQRWVAGSVKPTGYTVRRILRSKIGREFLNGLMAGCQEPWWIAYQRTAVMASILIELRERIDALK